MVGVDGSSPFAPTKFGREIKHLAGTLGAFFLVVREKYGNWPSVGSASRLPVPVIPNSLTSHQSARNGTTLPDLLTDRSFACHRVHRGHRIGHTAVASEEANRQRALGFWRARGPKGRPALGQCISLNAALNHHLPATHPLMRRPQAVKAARPTVWRRRYAAN